MLGSALFCLCAAPTSVSPHFIQTFLWVTKRWPQQLSLHVHPPWGNEGLRVFPVQLLACLGSNQGGRCAAAQGVVELCVSPGGTLW